MEGVRVSRSVQLYLKQVGYGSRFCSNRVTYLSSLHTWGSNFLIYDASQRVYTENDEIFPSIKNGYEKNTRIQNSNRKFYQYKILTWFFAELIALN